jgi:hypothetical protein
MSGVLKYFDSKKAKPADPTPPAYTKTEEHSPILTEADEEFLRRIASVDQGAEEPSRVVVIARDGKAAGLEAAEKVPLPASPPVAPHTSGPHAKPGSSISTAELAKIKGKEALQYVQSRVPFSKVRTSLLLNNQHGLINRVGLRPTSSRRPHPRRCSRRENRRVSPSCSRS